MRTRVLSFVLTSILMSLSNPSFAQQGQRQIPVDSNAVRFNNAGNNGGTSIEDIARKLPGIEISDSGTLIVNGQEYIKETRAVTPNDRGLVTNESYLAQLLEYAPEGLVCGYIMRNAWRKNLWGIFLLKEKKSYSLVYKEADKLEKRTINSDLATVLEASVNTQISKIEFDINNPVFTEVFGAFPEAVVVYEGDIAFAVTPSKAAYFHAWTGHQYHGIKDEYWQVEIDQFKQANK